MRTKAFYEKHGPRTIIFARFVPIVRTFTAFVAGVAEMPYRRFLPVSICAAIGWVFLLTMVGYEIGSVPFVRKYFDKIILAIIFVSLLPAAFEIFKARQKSAAAGRG
jgi:membrane-associated protein